MLELAISLANHLVTLKQLDAEKLRDTIDQAQMMVPLDVHIYRLHRDICISLSDASAHKRDEDCCQVSLSAIGDSMAEVLDPAE
ncbi:hypothetical protein TSTA_060110 [Talaromyces stipitatus ATCC 10500]|uniref:Uncharacterized protein n=1 Tax=Talaromyces stipitatus (strain ATCC 10500 / CBS 375.48 / QM 6759 / NRRL 1006) TaxID=441959 RepID=B8LU41_TALSN|nr:uncharacterized protein TSTA_060110 [Talaromyces stipitatus ATCC 10500]EED22513.1 hypothetical protein TSTA_060110 [Talaromyces stipitatus ATCC 10500]